MVTRYRRVTHYSPDFATMKEDIKPPTLIIMDESTRASQQDTFTYSRFIGKV